MEELYRMIEEKIRQAGYTGPVNGEEIYNEICDEMDQKENGSYLFMIKKDDDVFYECKVDIMDEEFDLPYMDIHTLEKVYHVDFDA
ncbi:MAG: hypothetical protein Q4F28_08655 [Eubacteriales bacterium]|nr:hypothetical protein [Eubacteriales bacterium]